MESESQLDSIAYRIMCYVAFDRETFAGYTKWSAVAFFGGAEGGKIIRRLVLRE